MIRTSDPGLWGLFYVRVTKTSDWLGALYIRPEGNELLYRMRHNETGGPGGEKNWYRVRCRSADTVEESVALVRDMLSALQCLADTKPVEVIKWGKTPDEFAAELARQPWLVVTEVQRYEGTQTH